MTGLRVQIIIALQATLEEESDDEKKTGLLEIFKGSGGPCPPIFWQTSQPYLNPNWHEAGHFPPPVLF